MSGPSDDTEKAKIFLSYRRDDAEHSAGRLSDHLADEFGDDRVFIDVEAIPPGLDFHEVISSALANCCACLVVIGPEWLDASDEDGNRRLEDPGDLLVFEIEMALTRSIPVVPVLLDGAKMPRADELPTSIRALTRRNATHLDAVSWLAQIEAFTDDLCEIASIERISQTPAVTPRRLPTVSRRSVLVGGAAVAALGAAGAFVLLRDDPPEVDRLLWTFQTNDEIYASPALAGSNILVGSTDGNLYGIDRQSGTERWRYGAGSGITSTPAVSNGVSYFGSDGGQVHAVNAASGSPMWRFDSGATVHSSPVVQGSSVFVGSRDNQLYSIDARTGDERWTFRADDWFNSSPAVANGVVYIGCRDKHVYAIDAGTGAEQWRFETASTVDSSPAVVGDTLWIGGDDTFLHAIKLTGSEAWKASTEGGVVSTPLVAGRVVYVGSDDGNVYAFDSRSGRKRWALPTGGGVRSSPAILDDTVYVGSRDGYLYAIDASTGNQRWRFETKAPIDDCSPLVVDGVVYIGSLDGRLYALQT